MKIKILKEVKNKFKKIKNIIILPKSWNTRKITFEFNTRYNIIYCEKPG